MRTETVTTSGKRKNTRAVAIATNKGGFSIKVNNYELAIHTNTMLQAKLQEVIDIIGQEHLAHLNFEIKTRGGGSMSMVEASKQAFCKSVLAYYGKFKSEEKKQELKEKLLKFDKFSLVTDARRTEPKKAGGPGARSKYTKSYR